MRLIVRRALSDGQSSENLRTRKRELRATGGAGRASAPRCRWGRAPAGMSQSCGGGEESQQACPGPMEVARSSGRHALALSGTGRPRGPQHPSCWVQGRLAAGLRQGLGQQPCRRSWGRSLSAKKIKVYPIDQCTLSDVQCC